MYKINPNFSALSRRYLFSMIASKVAALKEARPEVVIIRMGIGDVTLPLAPAAVEAMRAAVGEFSSEETFHGYGPEHGYDFLRRAIVDNDYRGMGIRPSDVFISDGAKSDTGNIVDLFGPGNVVAITDPVYPVYVDTNIISGRDIRYIPCNAANSFTGDIPEGDVDIIYLCFPNNPTGAAITAEKLSQWVRYALDHGSIILYDAAYEAYIRESGLPHSIYEIEGARQCAIEFRSFSKTAGFTGVRCGFTVIPEELGELNGLWERRQGCKFNGASYISQRGAEAIYSPEGKKQVRQAVDYYLANAAVIRQALGSMGLEVTGGVNSPYVWAGTPGGMASWDFFDLCLGKAGVVVTPGAGFGVQGEGYFRVSAFGSRQDVEAGMERMKDVLDRI